MYNRSWTSVLSTGDWAWTSQQLLTRLQRCGTLSTMDRYYLPSNVRDVPHRQKAMITGANLMIVLLDVDCTVHMWRLLCTDVRECTRLVVVVCRLNK